MKKILLFISVFWSLFGQAEESGAGDKNAIISSETTLSEAIGIFNSSYPDIDEVNIREFEKLFLSTEVGVHAAQIPVGTKPGESFTTSSEKQASIGMTKTSAGDVAISAFADPPLFMANFGEKFANEGNNLPNANMSGRDLAYSALSIEGCDGIKLSSGTDEKAIMLHRGWLTEMLNNHSN